MPPIPPAKVSVDELMHCFTDLDEKTVRDKLLNVCGCYPTWTGKNKEDKSSREYVLSSDYQLLQVGALDCYLAIYALEMSCQLKLVEQISPIPIPCLHETEV